MVAGIAGFAVVSGIASLIVSLLQELSAPALALSGVVFTGSVAALVATRRRRRVIGAAILSATIALTMLFAGLFHDGLSVMLSPSSIGLLVLTGHLVGRRGGTWLALLLATSYLVVFTAHMSGHVIHFDLVPGDPRPMMLFDAIIAIPAVWYVQRLDRFAKEAADARLMQNLRELQNARDRLAQIDKMAAVGQLAAGVAHELNNPLGVILGFAQGLERRLSDRAELQKPVASIVRESLRCRDLVRQLLTFSRAGKRDIERFDANEAVRSVTALVETRAKMQGVRLTAQLASEALPVVGTRAQVEQVVLNLANNALDAMEKGGNLTVRTAQTAGGTTIEVADTGSGIAPENRARVFEPFFTTKPVGKGTGLGLSICWEIVQQLGGTIDLTSELGHGTTMTVKLPVGASAGTST